MTNTKQKTEIFSKLQLQPSQKLIDIWKVWMAVEIINHLKGIKENGIHHNSDNILPTPDFEDREKFKILHRKLNEYAASLKKDISSLESLETAKQKLETYYQNNTLVNLQETCENDDSFSSLKASLDSELKVRKPEALKVILHNTSIELRKHKDSIQRSRRDSTRKEVAAFAAYDEILQSSKAETNDAWKKLILAINLSLSIAEQESVEEKHLQAIMLCNIHQNFISGSLNLLTNIERSLEPELSNNAISLPISFYMGDLKALNRHEKLLTDWIGYSVNYWYRSLYQEKEIKQKLLDNLEKPVRAIFDSFVEHFIEPTVNR